jgi:hypothetical protein
MLLLTKFIESKINFKNDFTAVRSILLYRPKSGNNLF